MLADEPPVERGPLVRSPEQVTLELTVAGPSSRMLAYAVDYLLMLLTVVVAVAALAMAAPVVAGGLLSELGDRGLSIVGQVLDQSIVLVIVLVLLALSLVEMLYFVVWEVANAGRSPGKALVGLRVVRDGGLPITLGASLVRNLLRVVDSLPASYAVGLIAIIVSPQAKRLGDVAAGTLVVRLDRPPPVLPLPAAPQAGLHAFRFDRRQAARIGAPETMLARETLRRLERLDADEAARLAATAVEALVTRLGCEPVAAERHRAFLHAVLEATKLR